MRTKALAIWRQLVADRIATGFLVPSSVTPEVRVARFREDAELRRGLQELLSLSVGSAQTIDRLITRLRNSRGKAARLALALAMDAKRIGSSPVVVVGQIALFRLGPATPVTRIPSARRARRTRHAVAFVQLELFAFLEVLNG